MILRRTCLMASLAAAALLGGCSAPDFSDVPDPTTVYRESLAQARGRAELPALDDNSTLADYLTYAALNNPGLEAAFHRWQAALERIPQVTALPEPVVTYKFFILAMDMRHTIGIEQMIPGGGKLKRKGDAAFAASEAERERLEAERVKLVNTVKQAYFEYYYLSREIAVTAENRELLKYLQNVANARFKVGGAPLTDVVKGQVELGKLDDELRSLRAMQQPSAAKLNAALNRPPLTSLPFPAAIAYESVDLPDAEILAKIAETNPELRSFDHDIAEQKAMQAAAKAEYNPDWIVGLEYMAPTSTGEHQLALMLGVTLPVRTEKYKAMYREALLRERAALRAKEDMLNRLNADATMAIYGLRDAERKIGLYRDTLIPSARESIKTTETAYAAGKVMFLDLLDAERVLLEFMLSQERALSDHAQKLAELEMIVGTDLPRSGAAPAKPEPPAAPPDETTPAEPGHPETPPPAPEQPQDVKPSTSGAATSLAETETKPRPSTKAAVAPAAGSRW